MPNPPSITSTRWRDTLSDGALPAPFEKRSDPTRWRQLLLEDWEAPSSQVFKWTTVDETTDGRVRFITTVDVDMEDSAHVSQDAWRRMLCLYVVGNLSGNALGDACEALNEIYVWQIEQGLPVPQILEQKRHTVSRVRQIDRTPFAFDEE